METEMTAGIRVGSASVSGAGVRPRSDGLAKLSRGSGRIPASLLADHVAAITGEADDAVRHEAIDAVLRRVASAQTGGLKVVASPAAASRLGTFQVASGETAARRYKTSIEGLAPLRASCE